MAQNTNITTNNDFNKSRLIEAFGEINVSAFLDRWGPEKIVQLYDPEINMQGILVVDNTILGPGIGGIRISPTITPREIFQSARTMTWTCALANISFGGAKAGIRANPLEIDKSTYLKSFARKISQYVPEQYIATPDTNVGQEEMTSFVEEIGDTQGATGKPEKMGGIPLELGATGFGIGVAIENALITAHSFVDLPSTFSDAKISIQGFENIGSTVAKYVDKKGGTIVAISDQWNTIYNKNGINIDNILKYSSAATEKQSIKNYKSAKLLPKDSIIQVDCDIFVSSSDRNVLTEETVNLLKAKMVVEGINNPITPAADQILHQKRMLVLPNILTNAGAVISSYAEYTGKSAEAAFTMIEAKVKENTKLVVQHSLEGNISVRRIAKEMAKERILEAMEEKT